MAYLPGDFVAAPPAHRRARRPPGKAPLPPSTLRKAVASAPVIDPREVRRVISGLNDDAWCKFGALDRKRPAPPLRAPRREARRRSAPNGPTSVVHRMGELRASASPSSSRARGRTRRGPAQCTVSHAAAAGCGRRRSRPREPPTSIAHDRVLADLRGGGGSDRRRCDGVRASRAPVVIGRGARRRRWTSGSRAARRSSSGAAAGPAAARPAPRMVDRGGSVGAITARRDFSEEEWDRLGRAPLVAAMAISIADPGGPIEAIKETGAAIETVLEAARDGRHGAFVQAIAGDVAAKAHRRENPMAGFRPTGAQAREQVLDELRAVNALLVDRTTPEETSQFRDWLRTAAQGAALAAKEGGFLGFNAQRVSENEQQMLEQLGAIFTTPPA